MGTHFDAARRLAGPQHDRHGPAPLRVVDVDRQEAAFVIMSVEQRELLMAVDDIAGVVDVERDGCRLARIAVHPCVDQGVGQADHVAQSRRILQPRHVGWEHKSRPVSGSRPQASLNAGSDRSGLARSAARPEAARARRREALPSSPHRDRIWLRYRRRRLQEVQQAAADAPDCWNFKLAKPDRRMEGVHLPHFRACHEVAVDCAKKRLASAAGSIFVRPVEQPAALTVRHAVPAIYQHRDFPAAGGLMSYGSDVTTLYRLAVFIRPGSQWRQPRRSAGAECNQIRAGHQSRARQPRHHSAATLAWSRRPGDRVTLVNGRH